MLLLIRHNILYDMYIMLIIKILQIIHQSGHGQAIRYLKKCVFVIVSKHEYIMILNHFMLKRVAQGNCGYLYSKNGFDKCQHEGLVLLI